MTSTAQFSPLVDHSFIRRADADERCPESCGRCGRVPSVHPAPVVTVGGRDPSFERDFIDLARRRAGVHESWADDVHDRLQRMEREKGTESYLRFSLRHLVNEADEEALDIAGWPMLAALLAVRDIPELETRQTFQDLMCQLASLGAQARAVCDQAKDLLA